MGGSPWASSRHFIDPPARTLGRDVSLRSPHRTSSAVAPRSIYRTGLHRTVGKSANQAYTRLTVPEPPHDPGTTKNECPPRTTRLVRRNGNVPADGGGPPAAFSCLCAIAAGPTWP